MWFSSRHDIDAKNYDTGSFSRSSTEQGTIKYAATSDNTYFVSNYLN